MKSLGNFPDPFLAEIRSAPSAAGRAAEGLADQPDALVRLAAAVTEARTIVFTGMGSSYFACHPAVTLLASAGIPCLHVDSAELLHFRLPILKQDTLLVAVSQSGESAEVVGLTNATRNGADPPFIVSVTNGGGSLADTGDVWLDTRAGDESGPSTITFAATLVVLYAISHTFVGAIGSRDRMTGAPSLQAVITEVTDRTMTASASAIASAEALLSRDDLEERLGVWVGDRVSLTILGRGSARAAAEMGALTIKESAGVPVEALQTAQFRHGPLELAGPELAAMVIATEPKTRDLDLGLAAELAGFGTSVLVVSDDPPRVPGAEMIQIDPVEPALSPIASIVPSQLLARRMAISHGREPGSYLRASKVTTRE